jgi:DNA transformation protein
MSAFSELIQELLAPLGGISLRRMFGSFGVFSHGTMFGLVKDDTLYFRADDLNRPAYEAAGSEPFTYMRAGERTSLAYWTLPEDLLDEPDAFRRWAVDALAAAHRVAARRPASSRTRKR